LAGESWYASLAIAQTFPRIAVIVAANQPRKIKERRGIGLTWLSYGQRGA
jgi:hypothetical protein